MAYSPSEPTQVVRMLGAYQSSMRHSRSGSTLQGNTSQSGKRSLATRLAFDDSCLEDELGKASNKITRLGSDPFSSSVGNKRFPSANSGALIQIQEENELLKTQLNAAKIELAGALANGAASEKRLSCAELEVKREKVERSSEKERLEREMRDNRDKVEILQNKIKRLAAKEKDSQEEGSLSRKLSNDKTHELELRVRQLREDKIRLEEDLTKARLDLSKRAKIDELDYQKEIHEFKATISELEQKQDLLSYQKQKIEEKHELNLNSMKEFNDIKNELKRAKMRVSVLESESRANQEAVLQRQAMRDKLEKFSELEQENVSLKNQNELLVNTAANSALLKEQVNQQAVQLTRMEDRVKDMNKMSADLEVAHNQLAEWGNVIREWLTIEERVKLEGKEVNMMVARDLVRRWQAKEVDYVDEISRLQNKDKMNIAEATAQRETVVTLEANLNKVKKEQGEQTKLLKRLQRKLLLVTKERDSFKGVLDSYEKEITLSGQDMDKERFAALEKTLEEYRAMIEMLEDTNKKETQPVSSENEGQIKALEEENAALQLELEQRSIRGDFNPTTTKVIHFSNNPMFQAIEKKEKQTSEILQERDALKARVQLLEEGQTSDLTMLVGQKLESDTDGHEVNQLKEQLQSAELKMKRLREAFQKTSKDFREIAYQLTGYRIDGLSDNKYRVRPLYSDNSNDYLLFQKTLPGEIQLLESEFSLELEALRELHLGKQNSIPMFLAGLTMQLWNNQNPEEQESFDIDDVSNMSQAGSEIISIEDE